MNDSPGSLRKHINSTHPKTVLGQQFLAHDSIVKRKQEALEEVVAVVARQKDEGAVAQISDEQLGAAKQAPKRTKQLTVADAI